MLLRILKFSEQFDINSDQITVTGGLDCEVWLRSPHLDACQVRKAAAASFGRKNAKLRGEEDGWSMRCSRSLSGDCLLRFNGDNLHGQNLLPESATVPPKKLRMLWLMTPLKTKTPRTQEREVLVSACWENVTQRTMRSRHACRAKRSECGWQDCLLRPVGC